LYDPEDPEWQGSQIRENIGFYIPSLKDSSNWQGEFRKLIIKNERMIGPIPIPKTKKGNVKKSVNLPDDYVRNFNDLRGATQKYLEDQLDEIKSRNNNSLKRNKSWFSEEINEV